MKNGRCHAENVPSDAACEYCRSGESAQLTELIAERLSRALRCAVATGLALIYLLLVVLVFRRFPVANYISGPVSMGVLVSLTVSWPLIMLLIVTRRSRRVPDLAPLKQIRCEHGEVASAVRAKEDRLDSVVVIAPILGTATAGIVGVDPKLVIYLSVHVAVTVVGICLIPFAYWSLRRACQAARTTLLTSPLQDHG